MTFSVVFAYVADITQEHERSMAYGLVWLLFCSIGFLFCLYYTQYLILQSVKLLKTDIFNSSLANQFQPEVGLKYSHPVLWLLLNIPLLC